MGDRHQPLNTQKSPFQARLLPGPVRFEEGGIVNDGGQQGRERPQQKGGEELGDDGILQVTAEVHSCQKCQQPPEHLYIQFSGDNKEGRSSEALGTSTHIEILHWFSNIELVHGGDDDRWGGEEEEQEEEDDVDD